MSKGLRKTLDVMRYFYGVAWEREPGYLFLILARTLVQGFSPLINIMLPKLIIDELLGQRRVPYMAGVVLAIIFLLALAEVARAIIDYYVNRAETRLDLEFERRIGGKVMGLEFQEIENPSTLIQLERARTGMSWYSDGVRGLSLDIGNFFSGLITVSLTLTLLSRLGPVLVALLLALVGLNLIFVFAAQNKDKAFRKGLVDINRRFSYYFQTLQNLSFGKDVRLFKAGNLIVRRAEEYSNQSWKVEGKRALNDTVFSLCQSFISGAQQALLYAWIGAQVILKRISIGDFQMLIGAAFNFAVNLSNTMANVVSLTSKTDFMAEYLKFMDYPDAAAGGTLRLDFPRPAPRVEFRGVSFKYPGSEQFALRDVSLEIPAAQRLSIVGKNGAGKTTFIKLLCGLYRPTVGEILVDGVNVAEYGRQDYFRLFSVVFQDFKLFSFSVAENMSAGLTHESLSPESRARLDRAVAKAGFSERLKTLDRGYDSIVWRYFDDQGVEFSGGEAQKMALARAWYKDAPVAI
jgi:ABC-type bacteriocin/lantibiotic exporter with double-glycine peptidase domain